MQHLTDPARCPPGGAAPAPARSGAHGLRRRAAARAQPASAAAPRLTDALITDIRVIDARVNAPRLTAPRQFAPVHVDGQHDPFTQTEDRRARERRPSGKPHVLHVDSDDRCAAVVAGLLTPEVHVTRVSTLTDARRAIANDVYSLVILDPYLPDGNGATLVPQLNGTPVLLHSEKSPAWQDRVDGYLPKPWTTHRAMWLAIAGLLGLRGDLVAEG